MLFDWVREDKHCSDYKSELSKTNTNYTTGFSNRYKIIVLGVFKILKFKTDFLNTNLIEKLHTNYCRCTYCQYTESMLSSLPVIGTNANE